MKDFLKLLPLVLLLVLTIGVPSSQDASAQDTTYVEIPSDFSFYSLEIAPGDNASKIVFWSRSRDNVSLPLGVRIWGPIGASVKAYGTQLKGSPEEALKNRSKWYPIRLGDAVNGRGSASLNISSTRSTLNTTFSARSSTFPAERMASTIDVCSLLDASTIQFYIQFFTMQFGGTWDRTRVCDYLNEQASNGSDSEEGLPDNSPDSDSDNPLNDGAPVDSNDDFFRNPANSYVDGVGYFQKDNCAARINAYLGIIEVDLSGVDRSQFPAGIPMRAQLSLQKFTGRTASSLKPSGDEVGKYAGRPLILMSTVYSADEKITVTSWRKGKPHASENISVSPRDRVSWRGFSLARAPIDKLFSKGKRSRNRRGRRAKRGRSKSLGRKGTFDIMSPSTGYGVCFQLKRVRQRKNGYPS